MMLRGLTRAEYDNTISAVLGEPIALAAGWGEEVKDSGGFPTARPISGKEVGEYLAAAESISTHVTSNFTKLWNCDTASKGESTCASSFVERIARAAFRRPILDVERTAFVGLFTTARTTHGLAVADAAALTVEAILQSPSFMYHWELGPQKPSAGANGRVALTAYEVAARLSYFLTQGPPDAALAADADSGRVLDPATLRQHATRLLAQPAGAHLFELLVAKMLNLSNDATGANSLDSALLESRHRFIGSTLGAENGSIQSLLLSTDYFVNADLAPLYGLSNVTGTDLVSKPMNAQQRLGILTHADYLKYTGKQDDSFPPRRGLKLLTEFLCGEIPAVPPIPPMLMRTPGQTQREFFETQVETQACAKGCHSLIDPLGYAFEHYGGSTWRDTDQASGKPINSSGSVTLPFGQVVNYSGAADLITAIAGSEEYRQCMTRQAFRLATGRAEAAYDVSAMQSALEAQRRGGDNLRAALIDVAASDAFRVRRLNDGEVAQ